MSHFIILTNPRNGSTWFADVLNNTNDITCHDELLVKTKYRLPPEYFTSDEYFTRVQTYPHWEYYKKRNDISSFDIKSFFKYFDKNLSKSAYGGFKLMFKQMFRHPFIFAYMLVKQTPIIRLKRKNFFNIILSWEAMKHRERGHNTNSVKQVSVYLDSRMVLKNLKNLEFWDRITDAFCKIVPVPVHDVIYEDVVQDNTHWHAIIAFITDNNVVEGAMLSKYKKSNTSQHKDMIENYEEIKKFLQNTKYHNLID